MGVKNWKNCVIVYTIFSFLHDTYRLAVKVTIPASQMPWVVLITHLCRCQCISMLAVITCCEQTIWPSASQLGTTVRRRIVFITPPGWCRLGGLTILLIHLLLCPSLTKQKNYIYIKRKLTFAKTHPVQWHSVIAWQLWTVCVCVCVLKFKAVRQYIPLSSIKHHSGKVKACLSRYFHTHTHMHKHWWDTVSV